jgi:hypothetical protein
VNLYVGMALFDFVMAIILYAIFVHDYRKGKASWAWLLYILVFASVCLFASLMYLAYEGVDLL